MNIDRSAVNLTDLTDDMQGSSHTSAPKKSKTVGFGKKSQQGPWLKGSRKGHGPSQKQAKATKTSGKFGAKREGRAQGKGANGKIR